MSEKFIFLRIAWMINYRGVTANDHPIGAGSFVQDNDDGGEVLNFMPLRGKLYGYARMQNDRNLNITRLGVASETAYIDGITVVFFAKNPFTGGQYVVGWYKNARLYRQPQQLNLGQRADHPWYTCVTKSSNAVLLPVNLRIFATPTDGPGQTNAWYVMQYAAQTKYMRDFRRFRKNPATYGVVKVRKGNKKGWLQDVERRKAIEIAAMTATELYFTKLGYIIKYVHKDNVGWDIEATLGHAVLRLEVKGTGNSLRSIELTPNEFHHSGQHANYRICIVEYALEQKKATLHICVLDRNNNCWRSDSGKKLAIKPITSARLELDE